MVYLYQVITKIKVKETIFNVNQTIVLKYYHHFKNSECMQFMYNIAQ